MKKTRETFKTTFAINMVARRISLGYKSAEDFSRHAKIPYPTIRDIEAGTSHGAPATRAKIAEALGCSVDELNTPTRPGRPMATGTATVAQMSIQEFRDFIEETLAGAEAENAQLRTQVADLRKTVQALKDILDKIPALVLNLLPSAPKTIRAMIFFLLSGEEIHLLDVFPEALARSLVSALKFAGVSPQKPTGRAAR